MRSWVIWPCLVGCSFSPSTGTAVDDGAVVRDGDPDAASDGAPDAAAASGCELVPAGLVACYQFEGDLATFVDGSGNHHDAVATGFTAVTRDVPAASQAIDVGPAASATVPQSSELSLTSSFTITAWMRPTDPDTGANLGIVDHEGAWALSIDHGVLQCWSNRTNGLFQISTATFTNDAWQFVACTLASHTACVHQIDATATHTSKCAMATGNGTNGTNGFTIGSFQDGGGGIVDRFHGALDDIRIYSRALTAVELCTLSGHETCSDNQQ